MVIGIDARGLSGNKSGIPTYIEEVIKRINNSEENKDEYIFNELYTKYKNLVYRIAFSLINASHSSIVY